MSSEAAETDIPQQLRSATVELERRLRAGEAVGAAELLACFPDLTARRDAVLELAFTEFAIREELGQQPSPDALYARFPQWRSDLHQLFRVHGFVGHDAHATPAHHSTFTHGLANQGP